MTQTTDTIIAIDLGTTNSLVGLFRDGQSVLIPNAYDKLTTPSAIAVDEQGQVLIGQVAQELRHQGLPVLTSFKRLMGTDKKLTLGNKSFTAVELSSLILQSLKQDAEQFLGESVRDAIITVPAYFNDIQRQATIRAAQLAGLNVVRLINEPTAAALAYGLGQTDDSCFLVFDLGGGTFDVSIVELFDGVIEVRASAGDNYLGGDDFIAMIVKQFWQNHATSFGQNCSDEPSEALAMLLTAKAQQALHQLTTQEQTNMSVTWQNQTHEFAISRVQFLTWVEPLLMRLKKPLERAMRDARIRPDEIDQVVMVGGATRILAVRQMVTKLFGRFPSTAVQPDEAIVRGACVQAGLKAKDACLKEVVLTDVCPFSLGIETGEHNQFDPIIERNTVIPASKMREYYTVHKGQREIQLRIYQGEHRLCKENIFLGDLDIQLPENNTHLSVEVRFSYNPNGILDVDVFVPSTGEKLQKVLINHQSVMTAEQIEQARQQLALLKIHPRDELKNKALILRADRLYHDYTGMIRQQISYYTTRFTQVLDQQNEREIKMAQQQFEQFLDEVEQINPFYEPD